MILFLISLFYFPTTAITGDHTKLWPHNNIHMLSIALAIRSWTLFPLDWNQGVKQAVLLREVWGRKVGFTSRPFLLPDVAVFLRSLPFPPALKPAAEHRHFKNIFPYFKAREIQIYRHRGRGRESERESEKQRSLMCGFTPQMPTTTKTGSGKSHNWGAQARSYNQVAKTQVLKPSAANVHSVY